MSSSRSPCRAVVQGCLVLAAAVAAAVAQPSSAGEVPRRRLESVTGVHDDVAPLAVDRGQSRWQVVVGPGTGGRELTLPTRSVVGWGLWPPLPQGPIVLLADGGCLAGRIDAADAATVTVHSATFGRLVLPAGGVAGWRAGLSIGPGPLAAADGTPGAVATVLLENGDRLTPRQASWGKGQLDLVLRTGTATVPAGVVRAVDCARFGSPRGEVVDQPRIFAAFVDGSWFEIDAVGPADASAPTEAAGSEAADGPRRIALVPSARLGGQAVECFATQLVALAIDGGAATRLALREPVAFAQSPLLPEQRGWPLALGRSVTSDWPLLRGETASTAIGMHAPAVVRYAVPAAGGRFESRVGIDDTAGRGGSVVVRVRTDAATGRDAFVSPALHGGEPAVDVRVELGAAKEIELVVEPADGGDVLDRVLWLDPRVVVPDAP